MRIGFEGSGEIKGMNHSSPTSADGGNNNTKVGHVVSEFAARKEAVDRAFDALMRKLKRGGGTATQEQQHLHSNHAFNQMFANHAALSSSSMHIPTSSMSNNRVRPKHYLNHGDVEGFPDEDEEDDEEDEEEGPRVVRSSDDEANSENLDEFSGLEELDLSEGDEDLNREGIVDFKRKKPKQREYAPNGRKQRGYHKWAGRSVALLSTGETGIVVKKPGGRITLRMDNNPSVELSSSEEKLHLMQNMVGTAAIDEIYEAAKFVPQWKDLKIGQRVAMLRYENATGRVIKLPDQKRALSGLGHVVVELDLNGGIKKVVMETLRMIEDNHPIIQYVETQKALGRPTKADVARQMSPPPVHPIIPYSKRGDQWRRSLRPPTGHVSPPQSPAPAAIVAKVSKSEEAHTKKRRSTEAVETSRSPKKPRTQVGGKPVLTRGQKLCKSCNTVIGTACRTCTNCGQPCIKVNRG